MTKLSSLEIATEHLPEEGQMSFSFQHAFWVAPSSWLEPEAFTAHVERQKLAWIFDLRVVTEFSKLGMGRRDFLSYLTRKEVNYLSMSSLLLARSNSELLGRAQKAFGHCVDKRRSLLLVVDDEAMNTARMLISQLTAEESYPIRCLGSGFLTAV